MTRQCIKCDTVKPLSEFCKFNTNYQGEKVTKVRQACYECNYVKVHRKAFSWANATDKEILLRLKERYDKYVIKHLNPNKCWDWKGFVRPDGYTRMKCFSRSTSLGGHVISWMIHKKQVKKDDLFILHKCDNRKCTNPKHLFLGDASANMIDMARKKRSPNIKLSLRQVLNIKKHLRRGATPISLSKLYKVNRVTISDIKNGRTWKHVK